MFLGQETMGYGFVVAYWLQFSMNKASLFLFNFLAYILFVFMPP